MDTVIAKADDSSSYANR